MQFNNSIHNALMIFIFTICQPMMIFDRKNNQKEINSSK